MSFIATTTREEFWERRVDVLISNDNTRREIRASKARFFGEGYNDTTRSWRERFYYYPDMSIEGWQRFFDEVLTDHTMKTTEFKSLVTMFLYGMYLNQNDRIKLFKEVCGNRYDENRLFIIRINREETYRPIPLEPQKLFQRFGVGRFLEYIVKNHNRESLDELAYIEYYESLLPHIPSYVTDTRFATIKEFDLDGYRIRHVQRALRLHLKLLFLPNSSPLLNPEHLQEVRQFGEIILKNKHLWPNFDELYALMEGEAEELLEELEEDYGENT